MANPTEQDAVQPPAAVPGITMPESLDTGANQEINLPLVGECFLRLRHAATAAHLIHLNTPSYAAHVALGEWYDAIVELADQLAEVAQGVALGEKIGYPDVAFAVEHNPVTLLSGVLAWIQSNRAALSPLSELQNVIDEIMNSTHSAQYKITALN
jgi:hypothetical protein